MIVGGIGLNNTWKPFNNFYSKFSIISSAIKPLSITLFGEMQNTLKINCSNVSPKFKKTKQNKNQK